MEMHEVKIDLDALKSPEESVRHVPAGRVVPTAVSFAAAVLIAVSLAVHAALAVEAFRTCKAGGGDMLLSMVLPETVAAKAEEPAPEKKKTVKTDNKEKTQAPSPLPYISCDLSASAENAMQLMNETSFEPDLASLLTSQRPVPGREEIVERYGEDAPLVLIYHTHGTEAYAECAKTGYRTTDKSKNVVAVGSCIAEKLREKGVGTIHLTEMFDEGDFNTAYDRSTEAVRGVLSDNPSVQFVLDIHRDSVDRDGEYVKCAAAVGGEECAQLMIVCGTDEGGSAHHGWQDNLTVSLQLQSLLWQRSSDLMRPIDLKEASFYQDTGPGALLLEFGASGNTLDEAKRTAEIFADTLCEYME